MASTSTTAAVGAAGAVGSESPIVPAFTGPQHQEFPPLSQQPIQPGQTMPTENPVDQIVLAKRTKVPQGQQGIVLQKDIKYIMPQTNEMLTFGIKQAKHTNVITLELRLLLEHEKKILEQIMTRCDKFKRLREENKRKTKEWRDENDKTLPEYTKYLDRLAELPQYQTLTIEGVPGQVQQKILFQLVSKTTGIVNAVVVQLSMQETIVNDIDLTLGDVKKDCTVMMKQINNWLKMLKAQECHQKIVLDRWDNAKTAIKDLNPRSGGDSSPPVDQTGTTPDDRRTGTATSTVPGSPGSGTLLKPEDLNDLNKRINNMEKQIGQIANEIQRAVGAAQIGQSMTPMQGTPEWDPNANRYVCRPCGADRGQGTGDVKYPGPPGQMGRTPAPIPTEGPPPPDEEAETDFGAPPPGTGFGPAPPPTRSSPRRVIPENDYFGIPRTPPSPTRVAPQPVQYDDQGQIQRQRAPPGAFPDVQLVDAPGMGFPIPQAALDRGGRPRGQVVPLTPSPPPPPGYGRFRPSGASSPGLTRTPVTRGPPPTRTPATRAPPPTRSPSQMGQPVDPALLPTIQEELRQLAERNRKLQTMVNNFKTMRATLTEEIDKAVRLNQKLQRDLILILE